MKDFLFLNEDQFQEHRELLMYAAYVYCLCILLALLQENVQIFESVTVLYKICWRFRPQ